MSTYQQLADVMICVVILLSWLINVTTLSVSFMMVALTLVNRKLTTLVSSILTLYRVSQSTDPSVHTISKSTSLSSKSSKNLSKTLWLGRTSLCLFCMVCQVQRQETSHKKNWRRLLFCMISIKDLQLPCLYQLRKRSTPMLIINPITKSVKSVFLSISQFSLCQSMLPNQKSHSLSVTIMTSLNQTLSWWSTSLTWDPLLTFPTSQPHLTLTNSSKSPHIDLTQWSVDSTLMMSTHWPVLSTNWVWWLVCCRLWLLWLVFSPKNSSVCKWSCCLSSLTFLSSTLMALCNCLFLPWNHWSSQQDTTCNGLTSHTLRSIRIHLNLWHWTLMSWHYHTTSIWWVCCMCCLWFWWYLSFRWKPNVSGSFRWLRWVTSGSICCWVKSCCTLCCSICSTFCLGWSSSTKMEETQKII